MKHPALARVFSVILAILSVLTFFAGIKGFGDTAENNKKSLEEANKLDKRRLSYIDVARVKTKAGLGGEGLKCSLFQHIGPAVREGVIAELSQIKRRLHSNRLYLCSHSRFWQILGKIQPFEIQRRREAFPYAQLAKVWGGHSSFLLLQRLCKDNRRKLVVRMVRDIQHGLD